jgi:hypothetical protein
MSPPLPAAADHPPNRQFRFYDGLCGLVFSLWWGGLTFYAAVVIPVGSDHFGKTAQGFVTQRVTWVLNGAAVVLLLLLARPIWRNPERLGRISWSIMAIATGGLIVVHRQLDSFLDFTERAVAADTPFYGWHQVYLWLTIVSWVTGPIMAWRWLRDSGSNESPC